MRVEWIICVCVFVYFPTHKKRTSEMMPRVLFLHVRKEVIRVLGHLFLSKASVKANKASLGNPRACYQFIIHMGCSSARILSKWDFGRPHTSMPKE